MNLITQIKVDNKFTATIAKTGFVYNIFKTARAHFFLHTVKWFHLFLSNMNNSIYY